MSFDEVGLPLRVNFGSQGGPAFSTEVIVIDGGLERRNQNGSQAHAVTMRGPRTRSYDPCFCAPAEKVIETTIGDYWKRRLVGIYGFGVADCGA